MLDNTFVNSYMQAFCSLHKFYSWAGPWIAMLVWQGQSVNSYKYFLLLSLMNKKIESLKKVNKIKEEVGNEKRTKGVIRFKVIDNTFFYFCYYC